MNKITRLHVRFINDVDLAISVMRQAAEWLQVTGKNPSAHWRHGVLNRTYLLEHADPGDFIVGLVDNKPAVAALLQDNERNQSWVSIDGKVPKQALYIHWLCVARNYSGKNLPDAIVRYAAQTSKHRNLKLLRLDTASDKPRLMQIYGTMGFSLMGVSDGTAFFQRNV